MNTILQGDCLEKLKDLANNSIDAVVTDPPYGLSFMGKKWDYDVPSVEMWQECLRVLKPGGYLLAFAGTRTQHRMAVRIEDAGFEIRDMIAWVYGSGFPKSLNIGKAVDKMGTNPFGWLEFAKVYKQVIEKSQFTHSDIDKHLGIKSSSCYWARTDERGGLPPRHHWEKVKNFIGLDNRYDELYDEVEREVVGLQKKAMSGWNMDGTTQFKDRDLTKGTSEWEGWGTALKPALEPITVARKPLDGTVAENCLKWGVGGINIDGCRVGTEGGGTHCDNRDEKGNCLGHNNAGKSTSGETIHAKETGIEQGRFPANLIHDGSDEVVSLFPNTKSVQSMRGVGFNDSEVYGTGDSTFDTIRGFNDSGSASRFFYCAKASKSERNKGCEGLEEHDTYTEATATPMRDNREQVKRTNNHPTVKPIALMEYLVKLVSKENHVVLDPFAGSGSTLIACKNLKRNYIGIEREPEYIKIIEARLEAVTQPLL